MKNQDDPYLCLTYQFFHSDEEKLTYLCHFLINILLFIILDKSENQS
jgi:hypothetical protein